ncbi:MAG: ThuA domain-containing protein [Clostridia bacterium]|nr:ThuA domain-containing protein [Clostridia bacterium]MBR6620636.1 ThuA domain-containing protein [Clostridia bacterium]
MINVTIYNEYLHEVESEEIAAVYPDGIHNCIAAFLGKNEDMKVKTVTLSTVEELTDELLNNTDVLLWWGHMAHHKVPDEISERVYNRVMCGMGFIALHSAHFSKPFRRLMGTTCSLCWREGDRERLWNIMPSHPIAQGIGNYVEIPAEEMYGERFDIPAPDELVFMGWFKGGEVFRSGCTWYRGLGKVFYFQPGHESNPTYHIPEIQRIITNAVRWAAPLYTLPQIDCPHVESPEANM